MNRRFIPSGCSRYLVACALVAAVCGGLAGCANEEQLKKADGYYREGVANLQSDQQAAFVSFQKAILENPKHRDAHYNIGHIYSLQEKYLQAEEEFREVLRIDPSYSEASTYLGNVLAEQDRWNEAIDAYRRALKNPLYETPDVALYNLGKALAHLGDMQGAAQAYEDALRVSPANVSTARINLDLGLVYYRLGNNAKARDALVRVTSIDKGGPYAAEADKLLRRLKP
jgi:type IV pilus assembly protein PilF